MMSNQCLNIFNHLSFCLFTSFSTPLKPYGFRPVFTYHNNCKLIGRKSRRTTSSRNKLLIAQSSSDIVLIATTEHRDGSLVFRFGDVSEVVENVEEIEEIESGDEQESNVSNVLDGDQERQVTVKTIDVDDQIGNLDIESDVAERETNIVCDLRDDIADSSERLADIFDEELIALQSDANMNSYIDVVEGTLDETERPAQLDGNESTDPTISPFDDSPNRDRGADPEGILLENSEDETEDPPVSVMLESMQVSEIEVEDVKQPYTKDELEKVEAEDINEVDREYLMPSAEENFEEELEGMNINDYIEKELEDMKVSEDTLIDEMPPSDTLDVEPTSAEVNMEISSTKAVDVKDQAMEDELQQISTVSREMKDAAYLTPVSCTEEAEQVVEEDLSEPQSTPLELNPTIKVSDTQLQDTMDLNLDDGILQVNNGSEDPSVSVKLETTQGSLTEVMDVTQPYVEDELHKVDAEDTIEGDTEDLLPPALHISDVQLMDAANENMGEGELQQISTVSREMKDAAYLTPVSCTEEAEQVVEEDLSEPQSTPLELNPTIKVSDTQLQDTMDLNLDDGILQVNNGSEDPSVSVKLETTQGSLTEVMDVTQPYVEDELHKVDAEDTIEGDTEDLLPPALHISDVQLMDAANENMGEGELQQISTVSREMKDAAYLTPVSCTEEAEPVVEEDLSEPQSTPLELKPTIQVSDIQRQDIMDQNLDHGILQVNNGSEDPSVSVKLETTQGSLTEVMDVRQPYVEDELHKVDAEDTIEGDTEDLLPPAQHISDVELMDAANENIGEGLQDMKSSDDTLIDRIPPSDRLGAEPTLDEVGQLQRFDVKLEATMEVSIKDQAVEDDLQKVITDYRDENDFANVMPAEPILEEEVSQPRLIPIEINPTMQLSDIELQDTVGQKIDDRSLKANDESEDPSVSVKLETMQVSQVEIVDVTQPYPEHEWHMVETEDTSEGDTEASLPPPTMIITSDVELADAANEDMEEGLQNMNISGDLLIDGMPPYDPLVAESTLDEVGQIQSSDVKLEATMELVPKSTDVKDQAVANEFQQVSTDNRDESDVENEMPLEPILEEKLSRTHSTPVTMQVSEIEVEDATGQNLDDGILQVIDEEAGDSSIKDVEQSSNQLEVPTVQFDGVNNMLEQYDETNALGSSILFKEGAHDLLLEGERTEGESRELAEESEDTALLLAAESEVKGEEICSPEDFLSSGAAFLEHTYKALTGGDDAYFLAANKWLGVANGVGQWSFEGTDPGRYAKELMRTCEEIVLDNSTVPTTNAVELLCRGVKETNMSGSSNVLIANFDGQALHVANIGDTGFLIIRHGAIYKKSSPLLHEFHFALQVENSDDPLLLVEEYKIELDEGDIVVSATDGLFDNLYEREIAMIVSKSLQAGMKPEEIANVLATRAQEVWRSAFVRSPFSDAAQAAGYTGYSGGKPDNVAVIVSLVEKISNLLTD